MNLKSDKVMIFNESVDLQFTSSGHYCINIVDDSQEEILVLNENVDWENPTRTLIKLHKQFGHASADKLKQLLKSAGIDEPRIHNELKDIIENCDTCKRHGRPSARPIVGLSWANDHNQTVAVDLHQLGPNLWYLHIIDEFSRFSAGCITNSKKSSKFVQNFIKHWISIHGAPQRLFSDLGGEFDNEEVRDMAENFNISIVTTPGYSPWSNGLLERHNQTLTEILLKIKDDHNLDWETALNWALMAKNSLHNVHGYSPYQLFFGRNPNIPSILSDLPPALEGITTSDVVRDHINALHTARQAFTKAESSEKIRRALRKQLRPTPDSCAPGDKVYYKRPDCKEWKGPGTVIGQDGPVVFIRHGGTLVRVHKCRLRSVDTPNEKENNEPCSNLTVEPQLNETPSSEEEPIQSENIERNEDSIMIVDNEQFYKAKLEELQSWKNNEVYTEVENKGQKCVSTRWVCSMKSTDDGVIPRARLVARGFEEINDVQKDSPTCAHESIRLIMALSAQLRWKLNSMDIKTAFLQGQTIEREVFVTPPPEAQYEGIWRLNKCVYGLSDASLHWYFKVKSVMTENYGTISKMDPAVFYWIDSESSLIGILACHVDDFIWSGNEQFNNIIDKIRNTFQIGKENTEAFKYCGINLQCNNTIIHLDQYKYTDNISPVDVDPMRAMQKDSQLSQTEKHSLRSKLGQLLWLAHQSRPDILFDACALTTKIKTWTIQDILQVNKIIGRAKSSKIKLKFQHLGENHDLKLMVFSDAAMGNLADGGSQGGYIILLVGERGKFSPIWWSSKKIRRVVHSTLAAETISMTEAVDMAIFISTLFSEITSGKPNPGRLPIICITDCKSLCEAVKSSKSVKEKRLRIELGALKEMIDNGQIHDFRWCRSESQLADCLTKKGSSPLLLRNVLHKGMLTEFIQ